MGILKSREEMIPVTCAVLKDEDREHFFSDARKRVGGNMDRIASMCGVPVSTVQDWSNGTVLIPYHALQRLAQELSIEQPQVSELRREFQAVSQIPQARRPEPEPPPSRAEARRELKKVQGTDRPPRRRERGEGKRGAKAEKAQQPPQKQKAPRQRRAKRDAPARPAASARSEKGPSAPKLSDRLAYWTGTLLAAARREEGRVVFSADRRMGQNFAGTWAGLTADLLGVRPALSMSEDRKVQNADLPTQGLEDFLDRLEFKPGIGPDSAPGAPRWTWSNPEWKMAFLRGLVDVTARFSRAPSLAVSGLSPRLRQSAHKILTSLGFALSDAPDGGLLLSGQEAVEKYFDAVGTGNMKLKDQFNAFRGGESAPADDDEEASAPLQPGEAVLETEVEPPLEAPASEGGGPEEPPNSAAQEARPAAASRRPPRRRPRRTAFRGKPGA